jgi:hypothetical protein
MSEEEINSFVSTMTLPNVFFGHINWCVPCRKRLEEACGCITASDARSFFQSKEIREMSLRHVSSCSECKDTLNQACSEEPLPSQPAIDLGMPKERAILLYRKPGPIQQEKEGFSLFKSIGNGVQRIKNWINRNGWRTA